MGAPSPAEWLVALVAAMRRLPAVPVNTVHYLLPSVLLALAFLAAYLLRKRQPLARVFRLSGTIAPVIVPRALALTTFLAGAILLFSGATPVMAGRLGWIEDFMPLPVVELSHFFASLAGAALLVLARGIQRRLDAAYHLTVALLAAGALFSLLKEFDYQEAILLSVMLGALVASRRYFYRKASLVSERFTPGWVAAITLVVLGSLWLAWISYGRPELRTSMFWNFSPTAEAPRSLRALAGVIAMLVIVAGTRLIRPARAHPARPDAAELERARPIVDAHPEAAAHLALLGDKAFLFNDAGTAFVMYGTAGRSWVALGDPVGPPEASQELVVEFIRMCDTHGTWPVFYKVGRGQLPLYLDLGLSVVKLGEEARVALPSFSLEGTDRRTLRRVWRKAVKDGCTFEVIPPAGVSAVLPALRAISNEWMAAKKAREKRFSLGWFDDAYVCRYPVGVARFGGTMVAFANAWPSGAHEELEVDLMRFSPGAPPGIMRYLLAEFMAWGRDAGYQWFNLGMSPLAGLRTSAVAPLWTQLGRAVFGHGERFYNFQGIREFKQWFHPVWEPRYLVSPGGALRPVILANIASLIAGGIEGVVRK